jgi:hypothetical protein
MCFAVNGWHSLPHSLVLLGSRVEKCPVRPTALMQPNTLEFPPVQRLSKALCFVAMFMEPRPIETSWSGGRCLW